MSLRHFTRIAAVCLVTVLGAASATSALAEGVRVRGSLVSLAGDTLVVKSREGSDVTIKLNKGWVVGGVTKASLADVKEGDFVGIASLPTATGGDGALEVLVFPPAMKGTGEGSYGWDLKPASTMTNGSVSQTIKSVDGTTLNVDYKGKSKKIIVTPGTPVVTFTAATVADLKPGAAVFVPADKAADGTMSSERVLVGKDGVVPPM